MLFRKIIMLSLASFVLVSCGLKIGEKNKTDKDDTATVQGAKCLSQSISQLKIFFKGEATDDQVVNSIQCLQSVFVTFKENTQGQDKNSYKPEEIAALIEKNFLKDTFIPKTFLNEIMNLKVALIGGTKEVITKPEIDLIVSFMSRIKPDLVRLNPHMKIISMHWSSDRQPTDLDDKEAIFQKSKQEFRRFVLKFVDEFSVGERKYQIDDLVNLVVESARFIKVDSKTVQKIEKSRVFLKRFKFYLIGGSSFVQGPDWAKLGLTLSEAYFQALRLDYFLDPLDKNQIDQKWSVYEKIASDLSGLADTLLQAKDSKSLTNAELFDMVQPLAEIFPQVQMNEGLINELAQMKVMLLGSNGLGQGGWSSTDFAAFGQISPVLFRSLGTLFQTIDLLDKNSVQPLSYIDFSNQETKVVGAIYELSQLIKASYDLKSLKSLLENVASTVLKDKFVLPKNFESLFKVVLKGQSVLTGQKESLLEIDSIKLLINVGMRAYLNYSEYKLFLSPFEMSDTKYALNSLRLWPKVKKTLLSELSQKKTGLITTDELTQFIMTLQEEKFLKTQFRNSSLVLALDALWSHLLNNPQVRIEKNTAQPGLNQLVVEVLSTEFDIYLQIQKNITDLFSNKNELDQKTLLAELKMRLQMSVDQDEKTGLTELQNFVSQKVSLNFNQDGFLKILTAEQGQYHYVDLFKSNLSRVISRLLIRGYAGDLTRAQGFVGVQLDEAEVAYTQLKPFAVDLSIIEEKNITFVSSRFREANLFLTSSNGDQLADFSELHQLILHIFSGVKRASVLKTKIAASCLSIAVEDIIPQTPAPEDCVLDVYLKEDAAFADLPLFLKMRSSYTPEELKAYYYSLLKAAGHIPNEQKIIYFADADLFPHVVQYIEMVYNTHDLNYDGFLQKDEALLAFPVFKELLKVLTVSYKQIKEEDLPGVFIYILKNGRPPKKESLVEVLKFITFIRAPDQKGWDIQSTRVDLGKIFNFIADATKPVVTQTPSPTPVANP